MRLRKIAAATLLALQALVASRPFMAQSPDAATGAAHSAPMAHHAVASEQPADCHHDRATTVSSEHSGTQAPAPHAPNHEAPPHHDHGESACHAGTPCCAPTLPMAATLLPTATAVAAASSTVIQSIVVRSYEFARRLPPATAPPARS